MRRIKGMTEIKVSVEDINHLNALIDRDTPKPIIIKRIGESDYECCPICNRLAVANYYFCPNCGQRFDKENIAL